MTKVLIIEDESKVAVSLKKWLEENKFLVDLAPDGAVGRHFAQTNPYDIVLLDLNLPFLNGYEVCREIKAANPSMPIILVTAMDHIEQKLSGFEAGADDYLVKPFNIEELVARIEAISRRKTSIKEASLSLYGIELFPDQHRVLIDGKDVELSKTEFSLLYLLMANAGIVLSKDRILEVVWEDYDGGRENLVEVYINYLRKKLGEKGKYIKTIRGVGYTFRGDA